MEFMMELSSLPSLFFPFSSQVRFLSELDFCLGNSLSWILSGSSLIFISICLSLGLKASLIPSWTVHRPVDFLPSCICVSILLWFGSLFSVLHRPWCSFQLIFAIQDGPVNHVTSCGSLGSVGICSFSASAVKLLYPQHPPKRGDQKKKGFLGAAFELESCSRISCKVTEGYWDTTTWLISCKKTCERPSSDLEASPSPGSCKRKEHKEVEIQNRFLFIAGMIHKDQVLKGQGFKCFFLNQFHGREWHLVATESIPPLSPPIL